ncbi:MAG: 6-carboxytetrahydropterin synthase [Ignavibacteriaceae bacterium]|jgi:6-pyruvoyltetrahydropterin/6-carboxytetrahydropterin synthase|nr:6-carboxytetrahydropterin synthase [Ignavibacteriaceae bacterium]
MRIAKEFTWEMGHRLPFHEGKCKNLHGHSYKMMVELDGKPDSNGMVLDYYDVKSIINPLVEELDHACLVFSGDIELQELLKKLDSRMVVVDFHSTAENLVGYFLKKIKEVGLPANIEKITVKVLETENTYAEDSIELISPK